MNNIYSLIPKSAFTSEEQMKEFRDLLSIIRVNAKAAAIAKACARRSIQ